MRRSFPKHILLPQEHGAWMMFLAPLLIGLVLGGKWNLDSLALTVAALAAFFARQPLTVLVKVWVGRRPRKDLRPALAGVLLYGAVGLAAVLWLLQRGHTFLLYLAVPGVLVLAWYLALVAARRERRQMTLDLVAAGIMALAAPAAVWVAQGRYVSHAWWLWFLLWLQSSVAIVYIFVRLEQRTWAALPPWQERVRHGWRALLYTFFTLAVVGAADLAGQVSPWLWLPFALQAAEVVWGTVFAPAVGQRPTRIGLRQLLIYALFTGLFLMTWE